jgi:hypothetical protein
MWWWIVANKKKTFFDPLASATKLAEAINSDMLSDKAVQSDDRYARVYREAQYASTLKKFEVDGNKEVLEKEALRSFVHRNHNMGDLSALLRLNAERGIDDSSIVGFVLRRAQQVISWVLGDITADEVFLACRHSGGVTRGISFQDTSVTEKSLTRWSVTENARSTLQAYFHYDIRYREACLPGTYGLPCPSMFDIVRGSRGTSVPKDLTERRFICVEPTGNMFLQQGLMLMMYNRLKSVGLDVTTLPDQHIWLAFLNSISGSDATVDFSKASDSVLLWLIRMVFPPKWVTWLEATRSPEVEIFDTWHELHVYATMGNATTFPVETLVFWAIGVGVSMFERAKKHYPSKPWRYASLLSLPADRARVSVFGDDCILPVSIVNDFIFVTKQVGFQVNPKKTFLDRGPSFRESCGGDFHHGRDVRPFYMKAPTATTREGFESWLYTILNGVSKKYISYFGRLEYVYEKEIFRLIFSWFTASRLLVKVVPAGFPDDSGLKGLDGFRLARAYLPEKGISPVSRSEHGTYHFKFLRFRYKKSRVLDDGVSYAIWLKKRSYPLPFSARPFGSIECTYSYGRAYLGQLFREVDKDRIEILDTPIRKIGVYEVSRGSSLTF